MSFKDLNKDYDIDDEEYMCCDECGSTEGECKYCEGCDQTLCEDCYEDHKDCGEFAGDFDDEIVGEF